MRLCFVTDRGGRTALVVAAALTLFAASSVFAQSAKTELKDPALATRFNDISDHLVCQCGCSMILRVCNHQNCPSGIPMRHEIEKQLQAGNDDDKIIASFVAEYGQQVLSEPPATGFNLAAYVMPGFGLLIGLFIVGTLASRWASKRRLVTSPAAAVDPELRERIENELRERS